MNYNEAIDFIEAVSWKGSVPGLERIGELCRLLGHPERRVKFVHVAGTNGKGSVSAIVSSILTASGYKTGLFTSPHLVDYTERIKICGRDVLKDEFCAACETVKECADKMSDAPTEFELLTALALVCFERTGCDVAVLECGMGGRLDATNIIPSPLVAVITGISLDHTAILGETEIEIASEKAGIIKESPVVLGKVSANVENHIKDICKSKAVPVALAENINVTDCKLTRDGVSFVYRGRKMTLPLCAEYQTKNLRTALSVIEVLSDEGLKITDEDIENGIFATGWKGRFETLLRDPVVIFDGAHNPEGAESTVKTFKTLFPGQTAVVLTGVMKDKDYSKIAKTVSKIARTVVTVAPPYNERALPCDELAAVYEGAG
ncbi:MAG: bifunctional folylpolyglutamate synthase/dihydrofolate synthase, partial [Clostridia bacterium]|nr:bifunctional folylpolyglutamate synthase/dihydrofolate synthase [Clostridia bacterium]